jgi:transaldolase
VKQNARTPGIWNPLPYFDTVRNDGELGNIQSVEKFLERAKSGDLPAVSWVAPSAEVSEHPPALVSRGQSFVTELVNAVMSGPNWKDRVIFLAWDDWGGFCDHVVPVTLDQNGYGLRVPALVIWPYARQGYIDRQTLSFDAYVKFIEDDFLGGKRLDPKNDGRPDPRPGVREEAAQLGDPRRDFNFDQPPRAPLILPEHPRPDRFHRGGAEDIPSKVECYNSMESEGAYVKFFLDTANLDELKKGADWGIVDGVTTNPTLIAKEGRPLEDQIRLICGIVDGDISAEVVSTDAVQMVREGRELARLHRNVVVKCPLTRDGIKATSILSKDGIRVNVTLCFSPAQAILAAKAGAYIVSPFVGRLDDIGWTGMDLIRSIANIYKMQGFKTQILVASVRSPTHVVDAASAGAHIATMPLKVLEMLFYHPLTDKGLDQFLKDWAKVFQEAPVAG